MRPNKLKYLIFNILILFTSSIFFYGCSVYNKILTDVANDIGIHPYIVITAVTFIIGCIFGLILHYFKKSEQKWKINKLLENEIFEDINVECQNCKTPVILNENEVNDGKFICYTCKKTSFFDNNKLKLLIESRKYKCPDCGFEIVLDQNEISSNVIKCPSCNETNRRM
jgi:DNA-directed RNA polymerase subunit RPC12/RpoP